MGVTCGGLTGVGAGEEMGRIIGPWRPRVSGTERGESSEAEGVCHMLGGFITEERLGDKNKTSSVKQPNNQSDWTFTYTHTPYHTSRA